MRALKKKEEWKIHKLEDRRQHVALPYFQIVKVPNFSGDSDPNVYLNWEVKCCSGRLTRCVFVRGLSSRARASSLCSVCEYLKRSEQRSALAAVYTPTIKSAGEKHQRDAPPYRNTVTECFEGITLAIWSCVSPSKVFPSLNVLSLIFFSSHSLTGWGLFSLAISALAIPDSLAISRQFLSSSTRVALSDLASTSSIITSPSAATSNVVSTTRWFSCSGSTPGGGVVITWHTDLLFLRLFS